jgi:dienelactone hydrolase
MGNYSGDVIKWVEKLIDNNAGVEIVIFGYSLGAATVLEASYKNTYRRGSLIP